MALLALGFACGGDREREAPTPPAVDPAPVPDPPPAPPDPPPAPPEPEPLGADPLGLDAVAGGWELRGDGLPAVSADGKRLARVQRTWTTGGHVRRVGLVIENLAARRVARELMVWDAARDRKTAEARLQERVERGNALLGTAEWRSLVPAEAVFPDGWIRCGVDQRFEVSGFTVSWREPRLEVSDRAGKPVLAGERPAWVVKARPSGCTGSYIGAAWLDPRGLLLVEIDHCGRCGVAPLTVLERWDPGGGVAHPSDRSAPM